MNSNRAHSDNSATRRTCPRCQLAEAACVCTWIFEQTNHVPILILQHPDERGKAIGSAKFIELGLSRTQKHVGLNLTQDHFQTLLADLNCRSPILLYHKKGDDNVLTIDLDPAHPTPSNLNHYDCLVLVDGTFRNVRELLLTNPWLETLPRLRLTNTPPGRYRLRQAQDKHGLSSVESIAYALSAMTPDIDQAKLLRPFEEMIAFQIRKMGPDVYARNYQS